MSTSLSAVLRERGKALFSGRIDVDKHGVIYMSEGQILDAKLGSATGEPALWRMLLRTSPTIDVDPGKPRATSGAVLGKADPLLDRFEERLDVLQRYSEKVGGFDRVWAIRFDALAAVLEELPDAINPVLRLLDGKRSVRDVVAEAPLDDMLAVRIMGKLLSLGILVLPDSEVGRISEEPRVVDVDAGLEAALAASLAEIEREDEPIPLVPKTTTTTPPAPSTPISSPIEPKPAAVIPPPVSTPPGEMPPPKSEPPTPAKEVARNVTMAPDVTLPVVVGLPSAPPVETSSDLRSWLGSEEAFFNTTPTARTTTGDLKPTSSSRGLSPWWMLAILVLGVALGMLTQLKAC